MPASLPAASRSSAKRISFACAKSTGIWHSTPLPTAPSSMMISAGSCCGSAISLCPSPSRGFEEANDGRRGEGHFQKALAAMELMHRYKIPFGVSICYTAKNYKTVTSDEFLDLLISKGCIFAWYFHYMPVGMGASTDLLLTPEQRTLHEKPCAGDPRRDRRQGALLHRFPE